MDTQRRCKSAKRTGPILVGDGLRIAAHSVTGDIITEQQNAIGLKGVCGLDDAPNAVGTHERFASVQVSNDSKLQGQTGRPARRRDAVARDARAQGLGNRVAAKTGDGHCRHAQC